MLVRCARVGVVALSVEDYFSGEQSPVSNERGRKILRYHHAWRASFSNTGLYEASNGEISIPYVEKRRT